MINFDIKKAKIYGAVKWGRFFSSRPPRLIKKIIPLFLIVSLLLFFYGFILNNFIPETNRMLLGACFVFLSLFFIFSLKSAFFETKIKNPKLNIDIKEAVLTPERYNLAEFLGFEPAWAAKKALDKGASSASLLYFLLKDNPRLDFIFFRLLLNIKYILSELKDFSQDEMSFKEVILESLNTAGRRNHQRVTLGDMLSALSRVDKRFKRILLMNKLEKGDIDNLVFWMENIEEKKRRKKRFWEKENLAKAGTLAREWTSGYAVNLDQCSNDITESIRKKNLEFIGHEKEIKIVERILSRGEINNVLIIGEEGTGKKSMIYSLAQRSLLGKSLTGVNYKRFVELDLSSLLARLENSDEIESALDNIFREVALAGNIILIINEIHNYIGQEPRPGVVDISGVIASYLHLPQFQVIGITNYEGLHRYIEKNSSILSLFGKVEISSILPEETLILLEYLTFSLENKHKIFISYPAVREIINLTDKYFPSLYFPEKAIDTLDEVAVYVSSLPKEKIVRPEHVAKIVSEKTEVPIGEVESKEKEILLNLESLIHKRIINQEEAVKEVSTALRRARSEVTVRKGPMGAFLFLGPTGVGKTETCKALAHFYFGSENKMIRLDMSEFQNITDIERLIGSEKKTGLLTTPVRENPFSLILLDELEKADLNVLNLFLQVLDDGHITDGLGRKVSFKNTIIIATSNAGYQVILKALKEKKEWGGVKQEMLDYLFENKIFRPEFINRFDATVVFKSLSQENLLDIAQLMLASLKDNLFEKGIEFTISEDLKKKIVELGYDPVFGARQMRRVIQDKVENILAAALLNGQIKRGDKISLDPEFFEIELIK